jgi:hypothetical protein
MATAAPPIDKTAAAAPPRPLQPLPGLLSYLVPGLGQVVQGRIAKGVLFFVCIYALFFYGLCLGSGTVTLVVGKDDKGNDKLETFHVGGNVYLPDTADSRDGRSATSGTPRLLTNLYNRPQFLGQFWVGVVAWPAVWQYAHLPTPSPSDPRPSIPPDPLLGRFMQPPEERQLNAVHTSGDKLMELGWVFTVIAGVLNIMVIYDALAGPAFPSPKADGGKSEA